MTKNLFLPGYDIFCHVMHGQRPSQLIKLFLFKIGNVSNLSYLYAGTGPRATPSVLIQGGTNHVGDTGRIRAASLETN